MDMTSTYDLNIFKISKWFCVSSPTHWSWSSIVFSQGMEAIQLDGEILFGLLKRTSPAIHKNLNDQDVMPILYMQVRIIIQMLNIRWFHRSGSCVSSHAPFHGRRYSGYVFFLSIWWWSWWWWQCWWFTQVWDMFCCEGVKVLFRVALVLIKHALPRKVSSS